MNTYTKANKQHNVQLEFDFAMSNERPTELAVRHLVAATGMSETLARATLEANGPRHD